MNSLPSGIARYPHVQREAQARLIDEWIQELRSVEAISTDILAQYDRYQKVIKDNDSLLGSKPTVYREAVQRFEDEMECAKCTFIMQRTVNNQPKPMDAPAPVVAAPPPHSSSTLSPAETASLLSLAPPAPSAPDFQAEPYAPLPFLQEAIASGLKPYLNPAALLERLKSIPDCHSKLLYAWCIVQVLKECHASRNTSHRATLPLPDLLAPLATHRCGSLLTLQELMSAFGTPEQAPKALTTQERAATVLSAQLLTPALFTDRAGLYAQSIEAIAEVAAKVVPRTIPLEALPSSLEPAPKTYIETNYPHPTPSSLHASPSDLFRTRSGGVKREVVLQLPPPATDASKKEAPRDFHLARILIHRQALTRIHRNAGQFDDGIGDPFQYKRPAHSQRLLSQLKLETQQPAYRDVDKDEQLFPSKTHDELFHKSQINEHLQALSRLLSERNRKNEPDDGASDEFLRWGTDATWAKSVEALIAKRKEIAKQSAAPQEDQKFPPKR